eukprot:CAMPEP_0196826908 /NCGR_PEP_ID=MMETSP1362-20130617/93875_1 /TAXON_ID=163516 /ORGANISM="Leptocylindrus danicus, Strain CCMP1856" /LENGTH=278 /DNA_ID=CAMNT_0042207507 /DNA_START=265 /DNA_END=1101 /DNA_ORIENTATION=-
MSTACTSTRTLSSSGQVDVDEVYANLLPCHEPTCATSSDVNESTSSAPAYDLIDNVAHKMDADFAESDEYLMHLDPSLMTALRLSDAYTVTTTETFSYNNDDRDIPITSSVAPNNKNKTRISNFYMDLLENEKESDHHCPTTTALITQAENNIEQWDDDDHQDDWNTSTSRKDAKDRISSSCSKWKSTTTSTCTQQADSKKGDGGQTARLNSSQSLPSTTSCCCPTPVVTVDCLECGSSLQVDPHVTLVFCPSCRTISPTRQNSSRQNCITEDTIHSV